MSERAQKLAIIGGAVALAVAYGWLVVTVFNQGDSGVYAAWIGVAAVVCNFALLVWFVGVAKGQNEATFFERAVGWLYLVGGAAVVAASLWLEAGPDEAFQVFLMVGLAVLPVPAVGLLLLGLLLGRDRFEPPPYHYEPRDRRERERPVHVRIIRRVTTIRRKRD